VATFEEAQLDSSWARCLGTEDPQTLHCS